MKEDMPIPASEFVMVPREPTDKMLMAAAHAHKDASQSLASFFSDRCAYRAMLEAAPPAPPPQPFQTRVQPWMMACFGPAISADVIERNHRFLEESLELVQSTGCTKSEAHQLVDYVYGRPAGDTPQEVGGVMVTLAALCLAHPGLDMHEAGEVELARIWTKVDKIRAKQAAKPAHSPLPEAAAPPPQQEPVALLEVIEGLPLKAMYYIDAFKLPPGRYSLCLAAAPVAQPRDSDSVYVTSAQSGTVQTALPAVRDVLAERERQQSVEGWTPEHDDQHNGGAMAIAGAAYALAGHPNLKAKGEELWAWTGWAWGWWKPKDQRSNLVRATALLLAEIERLDRASPKPATPEATKEPK